jgi:soluble lytic murein transglycosylase
VARRRSCLGGLFRAALVIALVAVVAFVALRGPDVYARIYHPLAYESVIAAQAKSDHVDPYLIAAVINAESGFRATVVSGAGAVGLMQVKPSTAAPVARNAGITDAMTVAALSVPATNIRVGTKYLAYLIKRYDGDVQLALAAYNAGLGNADTWAAEAKRLGRPFSDSIAFPETARYVSNVLAQQQAYRTLYPRAFGTGTN